MSPVLTLDGYLCPGSTCTPWEWMSPSGDGGCSKNKTIQCFFCSKLHGREPMPLHPDGLSVVWCHQWLQDTISLAPQKHVPLMFSDKQIKISGISDPWVGLSGSWNKTLKIKTYRKEPANQEMRAEDFPSSSQENLPYFGAWSVSDYIHLIIPFECPIPGTGASLHPVMWARTDMPTLFLDAMMEIAPFV